MKKFVSLILVCIMIITVFTGCSTIEGKFTTLNASRENTNEMTPDIFVRIHVERKGGRLLYIYKETTTNVLYLASEDGLTPMLNEDGTPLLYSEWLAKMGKAEV